MTDTYTRRLTVKRVIDGDTFIADVDLGFHTTTTGATFRCARVDTPELRGKDRLLAIDAREYTEGWLAQHEAHGGVFATTTKTDNWQRWLAEVTCGQGHNLSNDLLSTGIAIPYQR